MIRQVLKFFWNRVETCGNPFLKFKQPYQELQRRQTAPKGNVLCWRRLSANPACLFFHPSLISFLRMNEPLNFFSIFIGLTLLVMAADQAKKRFKIEPKKTRMFVHAGVAIVIFFAPLLFHSRIYPALLAGVFIIINLISVKAGMFTGMNLDRRNLGKLLMDL